ncbi:MAG: hypothetical protein QM636_06155, partial [Rhizobium sp.]
IEARHHLSGKPCEIQKLFRRPVTFMARNITGLVKMATDGAAASRMAATKEEITAIRLLICELFHARYLISSEV